MTATNDVFFFQWEFHSYKDLRQYILEMDKAHCNMVTQLGGNGDVTYDTLHKKKEEIWRGVTVQSDVTLSDVKPDPASDSYSMASSDEDIKELFLARAEDINDSSLWRLIQAL